MNMQDRLKAAARAKNGQYAKPDEVTEPAPNPEQALEQSTPEPAPKAQPKNLELDAASKQLLEENPIVPDAGKPAIQPPKANSRFEPEKPPVRGVNPFVVLGGVLAAGLLLMGGVALSKRNAPVPVATPPVQKHVQRVVEV